MASLIEGIPKEDFHIYGAAWNIKENLRSWMDNLIYLNYYLLNTNSI
jgi:hypothetical protein